MSYIKANVFVLASSSLAILAAREQLCMESRVTNASCNHFKRPKPSIQDKKYTKEAGKTFLMHFFLLMKAIKLKGES